jgi:hypothetical protein
MFFIGNFFRKINGIAVAQREDVTRQVIRCHFISLRSAALVIILIALGFAGIMGAATSAPLWRIGRAVIEWRPPLPGQAPPGQKIAVLKLSLRNEGSSGTLPVQIFGRWANQPQPPQYGFTLLGSYAQEVALKQTAIVEMALTPLRMIPPGKPVLELVVTTGGNETDRKAIRTE